jgi:hypothetical protein
VRLTRLIDSVNKPSREAEGQVEDDGHVVDEGDPSPRGR